MCNRICPTCIRNSHPDRELVKSWFEFHLLPEEVIKEALDQCVGLGIGGVCLSHYNEPLMDDRIPDIARLVRSYHRFFIFLNTNGDLITKELAERLDGVLDRIIVTLYMAEPIKSEIAKWIRSLFHKTEVSFYVHTVQNDHIPTHFSPKFDVVWMAEAYRNNPCAIEPQARVIINHQRKFLLCCDDVVGNFDLGYFPETSIKEYWFGEKHQTIVKDLQISGGRNKYAYCSTCPRKGATWT